MTALVLIGCLAALLFIGMLIMHIVDMVDGLRPITDDEIAIMPAIVVFWPIIGVGIVLYAIGWAVHYVFNRSTRFIARGMVGAARRLKRERLPRARVSTTTHACS